ncbi:MAG TPA: stage V sporulation protein AB [Lachnospiraceae bacterium]|nr:stage V sporulation protein AB [Lachnospiraceae bacterium]
MLLSLKYLLLIVSGFSFGSVASAGVFTVLVAVGIIPRFAGKTHTSKKVLLYEDMVIAGTIVGCVLSIFERYFHFGDMLKNLGVPDQVITIGGTIIVVLFGLAAGMFIGCLALAIAEMLDSIPILARRVSFRHGLGVAVCAIAAGKFAGSILYYILQIHDVVPH